ncbi:MAG: terminase, partial [Neisseria sp.]
MIDLNSQIIEAAVAYQHDPLSWAMFAYDWDNGELAGYKSPRAWQAKIMEDVKNHLSNPETRHMPLMIAVASGHGIGKSAEIGMLINWALSTCEDSKVVITSNTETQLRTKTAPEVGKWQRLSITADWFNDAVMSITA